MGSNAATVGNKAGKPLFTFTDVGQDTGPLGFDEVPGGYKARVFQLIGAGTGMNVTVYGTLDKDTALGNANNWGILPAPNTEASASWNNPLTTDPTSCLLYVNATFIAIRAVSVAPDGAPDVTGSVQLLLLAAP